MNAAFQIPRTALIWILCSLVLVTLPHVLRMPLWISLMCLLCVAWRILIFIGKIDYPGRLTRFLIVIFTVLAVVVQFRDLGLGLDSAVGLLLLGFIFKLLEMKDKRDIYIVISLGYVMSMVVFIYSQSIAATIYVLFVIVVITAAMISVNQSADNSGVINTTRMSLIIILQSIPLMFVLFILFPRIAPLWAVPLPAGDASMGVSDEMSPGDISQLGRSADLAFRVKFTGAAPPPEKLYWRGLVLDSFDGKTWRRGELSKPTLNFYGSPVNFSWSNSTRDTTEIFDYNVILEPSRNSWLYALALPETNRSDIFKGRNYNLYSLQMVTQRLSYDVRSYLNYRLDVELNSFLREQAVTLPEEGNEASRKFAIELRAQVSSDRDYVEAVLEYFREEPFYYTLTPPLLRNQRIDEFLFSTRRGFCGHYASSFVYLMRAAGVPARVVVGYQGAEYNPYEDYMMVYQYNAHAWAEVWFEGAGWVRVDPTAAVSPQRITLGVEAVLANEPGFLGESVFSMMRFRNTKWLNSLRLRLDAIDYAWNRWVISYDDEVQFQFLRDVFGANAERKILFTLIALFALCLAILTFVMFRNRAQGRKSVVDTLYLGFCKDLARLGSVRNIGEGPLSYCERVCVEKPELSQSIQNITAMYVKLAYGGALANEMRTKVKINAFRKMLRLFRLRVTPTAWNLARKSW